MSLNSLAIFMKMLAGLLSGKIISVVLGPSGMALLGNFKNTITSAKQIGTLGINSGIVKYTASIHEDEKERSNLFSTAFFSIQIMCVVVGFFFVVFSELISKSLFFSSDYWVCVFAFGLLLPLYGFHIFSVAVINGLKKYKALVFLSIGSSVFALLTTVLLILFYKTKGALLAMGIIESLIVVFYLFFFIKSKLVLQEIKLRNFNIHYVKKLSGYSLMTLLTAIIFPFSMLYIRNIIIEDSEIIELGIIEAGLWDSINKMSEYYLMILTSGITIYYLPKLSSIHQDDEFIHEIKKYFKTFIPLCALLFMIVFLFKGLIVEFVFSKEFLSITPFLGYRLLGDFFKICSYAFAQQFLAKKLIVPYMATEIIFYIIYVLCSVFLIKDYGIEGVVVSYLISYIVYFLMVSIYFRKYIYKLF